METFRSGTFETNSSSTHCLSVTKETRHVSAFPELNADGSIDIEAKHYWECDESCHTVVLEEIIEYICMLGYACERNLDSALRLVQEGYEIAGLKPPTKINLYAVTRDGSRISYTEPGCRYINGPRRDYYGNETQYYYIYVPVGKDELERKLFTHTLHAEVPVDKIDAYVKENPHLIIDDGLELKDTPILKYRVGVNPNDLTSDTLANALDNLTTKPFGCGKECSILEAFRYVSVLDFWHS